LLGGRLRNPHIVVSLALALVLSGCATGYQPHSWTGGYSEIQRAPDIWRIMFAGNANVTSETVQTYWLYRAAEVTIEKGYDGFKIITPMVLASNSGDENYLFRISHLNLAIPVYLPDPNKPVIVADIRLLKKPIVARPPKVFDAASLKATLEPLVKGQLCNDNVCPHVHTYLMPVL
jgi:hypothetical protein